MCRRPFVVFRCHLPSHRRSRTRWRPQAAGSAPQAHRPGCGRCHHARRHLPSSSASSASSCSSPPRRCPLFRPATADLAGDDDARCRCGLRHGVSSDGARVGRIPALPLTTSTRARNWCSATRRRAPSAHALPLPGLDGAPSRLPREVSSAGSSRPARSDGRVALMQVAIHAAVPRPGHERTLTVEIRDRGLIDLDPAGRPIRQVSYAEQDGRKLVAALVDDRTVLALVDRRAGGEHRASVMTRAGRATSPASRAGRGGALIAGTDRGASTTGSSRTRRADRRVAGRSRARHGARVADRRTVVRGRHARGEVTQLVPGGGRRGRRRRDALRARLRAAGQRHRRASCRRPGTAVS